MRTCRVFIIALVSLQLIGVYILFCSRNNDDASAIRIDVYNSNEPINDVSDKVSAAQFSHLYNDTVFRACTAGDCPIWREPACTLPEWMKTYFDWHSQTRPLIDENNWKSHRFIVMKCHRDDTRCGGTSDRIKPIPLILWYAYVHKRIIMIHWGRPCKLEQFLLPPIGGIDWRMPDAMISGMKGICGGSGHTMARLLARHHDVIVRIKYQSYHGGSKTYDEIVEGPAFAEVYHDVWRIMFTPTPPIAKIILQKMKEHNLLAGNYAAIHLRALYAVSQRPKKHIEEMAKNALACASHLRPGGPFYFASDSEYATNFLSTWAKEHNIGRVESIIRHYEPVHLEMAENWTTRPISDYYDTFTDLYLLGMSRCVAYGAGGYGQWGLMIGYNSSCSSVHSKKQKSQHCDFFNGTIREHDHFKIKGPVFRLPMGEETRHVLEVMEHTIKDDIETQNELSELSKNQTH